jgi:anti-anti-sigma factor
LNDHKTLRSREPAITVDSGQQANCPPIAGEALPLLTVALVPAPDRIVVRLTGETDLSTAPLLGEELTRGAAHGSHTVIVDVSSVRFWDCSGLHALADLTAELRTAGRECRIVGAGRATRRLIAMADFAGALELDGPVPLSDRPRRQPSPPPTGPAWERLVEIPA